MSLMQHYDKVITRMQLDICRLIEEKAEIEACVEALIAIRDQAHAVLATAAGTYNDKRTSVDRKKLSALGLMVKESYKTIPLTYDQVEVDRTSMVNQIRCSFAEDAYDEVIYFLRDMLMEDNPEILFVGWGGRTDESLFVEVRVR